MRVLSIIFISLLAIFAPIKTMAIATVACVIIDLITGLIAAYKDGIPITSSGLKQTILKLFVYLLALGLGLVIQRYLLEDQMPVINLLSTIIGATEGKSILENLDKILGQPMFATIISKLSSMMSKPPR